MVTSTSCPCRGPEFNSQCSHKIKINKVFLKIGMRRILDIERGVKQCVCVCAREHVYMHARACVCIVCAYVCACVHVCVWVCIMKVREQLVRVGSLLPHMGPKVSNSSPSSLTASSLPTEPLCQPPVGICKHTWKGCLKLELVTGCFGWLHFLL